jgi:hypothetical protein
MTYTNYRKEKKSIQVFIKDLIIFNITHTKWH